MSEKKVRQLGWMEFVDLARCVAKKKKRKNIFSCWLHFSSKGHFIEKLNLDGDPKDNPAFDVLLLKMTDELVRLDDEAVKRQVENARVRFMGILSLLIWHCFDLSILMLHAFGGI
jgi:hypothetical protein